MMTKDARLLSYKIVAMYKAPSYSLMSNRTHENDEENPGITYLDCLVIDRVDSVYSKLNTDEYDHRTPSPCRWFAGTR